MNENIQKMLELLSQDEEAMKKLSSVQDPDEAYDLVTSIHGGYTKEEFIEAMTELNNSINQDIDADDLSKAAGGADKVQKASITFAASATITGIGSVAGTAVIVSGVSAGAAASAATSALITSCAATAAV